MSDPNGSYEPSWFPDGGGVAFTSSRDGDAEITRVNADESDLRRLTASTPHRRKRRP
jgi:Tol biopolymer transport system component